MAAPQELQEGLEDRVSNSEDTSQRVPRRNMRCINAGCRNLVCFWVFGLTNNFAYVIMLSAANDILKDRNMVHYNGTNSSVPVPIVPANNRTGKLLPECNRLGTGAMLLADILPAVIIKLTAPFYIQVFPYNARIVVVIVGAAASFPLVAFSNGKLWMSVLGVVSASCSSGLGEITFLSLSTFYDTNTVSTWSSGTGAAGVFGSLVYAGFTALGVSPSNTIMLMLVVPAIMAFSYFVLLPKSELTLDKNISEANDDDESAPLLGPPTQVTTEKNILRSSTLSLQQKVLQICRLTKYMIPLGSVYVAEYFINQALFEILYFEKSWLPVIEQYRWYQVIYQVGVFISRSSVNLFQIHKIWVLPILQFSIVAALLLQVLFGYIPSIWIVLALISFEGLLGGLAYVNTFYQITKEVAPDKREFSMGATSVSDSLGIAIAGAISIPVHNYLCNL